MAILVGWFFTVCSISFRFLDFQATILIKLEFEFEFEKLPSLSVPLGAGAELKGEIYIALARFTVYSVGFPLL